MEFTEPIPFDEAIAQAQARGLLPTNLSSAQIAEWDDELKRLSVFSARTNNAAYLQTVKNVTESLLKGEFNEATARAMLQDQLDALDYNPQRGGFPGLEDPNIPPAEPGSLRDLSSDKRTQLVLRTQMRQMANRGYLATGTTPNALFSFPAWELIRIYPRAVERGSAQSKSESWPDRWAEAGGEFYGGRMIAAKGSPVWAKLGDPDLFADAIGTDYPPFAFNSGMGWRQIPREQCVALGVPFGDPVKPAPRLDDVQVSVKGLDREFLQKLRDELDLEIKEGFARLAGTPSGLETTLPPLELGGDPAAVPPIRLAPPPTAAESAAPGSKISLAAQLSDGLGTEAASFQDGLTTIDGVHGDGPLTPIPFNHRVGEKMIGTYWTNRAGDQAMSIGVLPGIDDTEFGLAHEVGHWLDNIGIPSSSKFASESAPELQAWLEAVRETDAYQRVVAGENLSTDYHAYLMQPNEFWARSYAQFIAEESGDPAMLASLQKVVSGNFPGLPAIAQWTTEDFASVRAAIRALFIKLGWILPPGI